MWSGMQVSNQTDRKKANQPPSQKIACSDHSCLLASKRSRSNSTAEYSYRGAALAPTGGARYLNAAFHPDAAI